MTKGNLVFAVKSDKMPAMTTKAWQNIEDRGILLRDGDFKKILTLLIKDQKKGKDHSTGQDVANASGFNGIDVTLLIGLLMGISAGDNMPVDISMVEKTLKDSGIQVDQSIRTLALELLEKPELLLEMWEALLKSDGLKSKITEAIGNEVKKWLDNKDINMKDNPKTPGEIHQLTNMEPVNNLKDILEGIENKSILGQENRNAFVENVKLEKAKLENVKLENAKGEGEKQNKDSNANILKAVQGIKIMGDDKESTVLNIIKGQNIFLSRDSFNEPTPVRVQDVVSQIVNGIKLSLNMAANKYSADIKLKPDYLGNISLNIEIDKGVMVAKFEVQSYQVKQIIESSLAQLKDALQSQGIDVQNINVTVDTGMGGQLAQHNGNNQWKRADGYRFGDSRTMVRDFDNGVIPLKSESGINYLV